MSLVAMNWIFLSYYAYNDVQDQMLSYPNMLLNVVYTWLYNPTVLLSFFIKKNKETRKMTIVLT